jgi:two-component system, NarL family, response regulator DegU
MSISVMIAEDDPLLQSFLKELLSLEDGIEVIGTVTNGHDCLKALEQRAPDVVLLDVHLPGLSGLKVLQALGERGNSPNVLVLSGVEDEETQVESARLGARGFLPKSQSRSILGQAIRTVASGETWFSRRVSDLLIREHQKLVRKVRDQEKPVNVLSDREQEVLVCVARGMTNSQIAGELFMSIHTVKLHIQNILRKLDLPNRTEAAVFAVREGLLDEQGVRR